MKHDGLRAQIEIHKHIALRDLPKRYVSLHLMLFGCWIADFATQAVVIWVYVTVLECHGTYLIRTTPRTIEISRLRMLAMMASSFLATIGYYAPAVLLGTLADFGLYTLALVWVFAALATTSTMYNAVPAFYWIVGIPGLVSAFAILLLGLDLEFQPTTVERWILPIGLLCVHATNTILLLWDYRDTHKELDNTRRQSLARLRQLEHLSSHDHLTGLLNRTAFDTELAALLDKSNRTQHVAVIMIDLNGFKPINDTYGHEAGDAVLVAIAERLRGFANKTRTPFRLGGDEFAILVTGESDADLRETGEDIFARLREPITYDDKDLHLSAAVGIASADQPGTAATTLYSSADQAMYLAKSGGSQAPVMFNSATFSRRLSLIDRARLEVAIRTGEIQPFYQPRIQMDTMSISGFEALARWQHPKRGLLMPGEFLGQIEELGLFLDMTKSMLRQVLKDISGWVSEGLSPGQVSVNIPEVVLATNSGREELCWVLAEFPSLSGHIVFEITEDVFIARSGDVIQSSIEHFRSIGVGISLDDFGTGYASFQHLRQLTFDELKIDTSFVAGLGTDPVAEVIVEGFVSIARGLGVEIVAEGVENTAQLDHLHRLGCQHAQGYLFSPAIAAPDARDLLVTGNIRNAPRCIRRAN